MSTQVEPKVDVNVKSPAEAIVDPSQAKVDALLKNEAIVVDGKFVKLLQAIDEQERKGGTKWYALIVHVRDVLLVKHEKDEAMSVILKSLLSQGKTYSSAQSIRSYITKMAKDESREMLEKLNAGAVTVQETRRFGRTAQVNPSKTNEDKFDEAVANAVRFGIACSVNLDGIIAKVTLKYNKIATD